MSRFATTRWSLIRAAGSDEVGGRRSLEELCRAYRSPVLGYLRATVDRDEDADELTQSFFVYFLEQRVHHAVDPEYGRFRNYLLGAVRHFVSTHRRKARTLKRGGNVQVIGDAILETMPADSLRSDPAAEFDRQWALALVTRALARLQSEARAAGKGEWFEMLRDFISEAPDESDYLQLSEKLGMRRNTVAVAVHRLRQRLSELVNDEMSETVESEADMAVEQDALSGALRR